MLARDEMVNDVNGQILQDGIEVGGGSAWKMSGKQI